MHLVALKVPLGRSEKGLCWSVRDPHSNVRQAKRKVCSVDDFVNEAVCAEAVFHHRTWEMPVVSYRKLDMQSALIGV